MFMRIALLFGINLLIQMKEPWFYIELSWFSLELRSKLPGMF
jgi:hypothetical protein